MSLTLAAACSSMMLTEEPRYMLDIFIEAEQEYALGLLDTLNDLCLKSFTIDINVALSKKSLS